MSRQRIAVALVTASAAAAAAGPAAAGTAPPARAAATGARVAVRHTALGNILVNGRGFTLYMFTRDGRARDRCVQISGCRGVWPLYITHGRPIAGRGVRSGLLGTIRVGRAMQVTYAGHPLYTYVADSAPGQTSYVGVSMFGGRWFGLRASGAMVR